MLPFRKKGKVRFEERCRASLRTNGRQTITLPTRIFPEEKKAPLGCKNTTKERSSECCIFFQGKSIPDKWNKVFIKGEGKRNNLSALSQMAYEFLSFNYFTFFVIISHTINPVKLSYILGILPYFCHTLLLFLFFPFSFY